MTWDVVPVEREKNSKPFAYLDGQLGMGLNIGAMALWRAHTQSSFCQLAFDAHGQRFAWVSCEESAVGSRKLRLNNNNVYNMRIAAFCHYHGIESLAKSRFDVEWGEVDGLGDGLIMTRMAGGDK